MYIDKSDYSVKVGDKAEQFPIDEILNKDDRIVRGWATVEVKDSQGERIPIEGELKRVMNTWMMRGGVISDTHSNRQVGKGLNWKIEKHPDSGKQGIIIDYQIFKDYSIDNEVWDEIVSGKRKGLSFGGRALNKPKIKDDSYSGEKAAELSGIEAYEMASVTDPANELALNTHVNFLAKSNTKKGNVIIPLKEFEKAFEAGNKLFEDMQKGYAVKDVKKPFAGFENFEVCTNAQEERGHSKESAERICGWLKHRTEKNWMTDKKKVENIEEDEDNKEVNPKADEKTNKVLKLKSIEEKLNKVGYLLRIKNIEKKLDKISIIKKFK